MKFIRAYTVSLFAFLFFMLAASTATAQTCHYYAATNGSAANPGTIGSPWTLVFAVSSTSVTAGKTVCIRAGSWTGHFEITRDGTSGQRITYRNYPGERVTIDNPVIGDQDSSFAPVLITGDYVDVIGLEALNSHTTRSGTGTTPDRSSGIDVVGLGSRIINCVIHDTGNGIFASTPAKEVYGTLIYNSGWNAIGGQGPTGHGIYTNNANVSNPKLLTDNIIINTWGFGIHAYTGSTPNILNGFTLNGNIVVNSGAGGGATRENLFIGGGSVPIRGAIVTNNYSWGPGGARFSYTHTTNEDLIFTDNVIGKGGIETLYWNTITYRRNKQYSTAYGAITSSTGNPYNWDANTFFNTHTFNLPFDVSGVGFKNFADWKSFTGYDATSTLSTSAPTGTDVFVRPNAFETGRANIAIFNWASASSVNVNLSTTGLTNGQSYEIRSAQNFYGAPVLTGTYSSANPIVSISMTSVAITTVAAPIGGTAPVSTAPQFVTLIVLPVGTIPAPTPTPTPSPAPTPSPTPEPTPSSVTYEVEAFVIPTADTVDGQKLSTLMDGLGGQGYGQCAILTSTKYLYCLRPANWTIKYDWTNRAWVDGFEQRKALFRQVGSEGYSNSFIWARRLRASRPRF